MLKNLTASLAALALAFIVLLLVTFPATWLLMLFFGSAGLQISYWGTLPLGILVSSLIGAASSGGYVRVVGD